MSNPRVSKLLLLASVAVLGRCKDHLFPRGTENVGVLKVSANPDEAPSGSPYAPAADPPPAFGWAARPKMACKPRRITQIGPHSRAREVARPPASCGIRPLKPLQANNCHAPKPVAEHANHWANLRFPIGVPLQLLKQETRPCPKHIPFPGNFPRERDRIPLDGWIAGDPNTPRQLTPEARFQDLRSVSGFSLRPAHADRTRPTDQEVPRSTKKSQDRTKEGLACNVPSTTLTWMPRLHQHECVPPGPNQAPGSRLWVRSQRGPSGWGAGRLRIEASRGEAQHPPAESS